MQGLAQRLAARHAADALAKTESSPELDSLDLKHLQEHQDVFQPEAGTSMLLSVLATEAPMLLALQPTTGVRQPAPLRRSRCRCSPLAPIDLASDGFASARLASARLASACLAVGLGVRMWGGSCLLGAADAELFYSDIRLGHHAIINGCHRCHCSGKSSKYRGDASQSPRCVSPQVDGSHSLPLPVCPHVSGAAGCRCQTRRHLCIICGWAGWSFASPSSAPAPKRGALTARHHVPRMLSALE